MTSSKKRQVVETIKHYIHTNYMNEITSADMARLTYYSEGYCERVFVEVTGISRRDYLRRCRLDKAKELLSTTNMKCFEIAYAIGYSSSSQLMETFKAKFGITMRHYRIQEKESQRWNRQSTLLSTS